MQIPVAEQQPLAQLVGEQTGLPHEATNASAKPTNRDATSTLVSFMRVLSWARVWVLYLHCARRGVRTFPEAGLRAAQRMARAR
jgi:hypothetical protein